MRRSIVFLLGVLVAACGPNVHLKNHASFPPQAFCEPTTFELADTVPTGSTLLAEVAYGDTGFSVSCGIARNKARLRRYACSIGADAIKIVAENYPNFVSTCYRVRALLYKLPAATPGPATTTGAASAAGITAAVQGPNASAEAPHAR